MPKPIKAAVGGSGDFELVPAGVYLARCYQMIDLGTQKVVSKQFGTKSVRQVMLYWEILQDDDGKDVFMEDGKRVFSISKTYTLSMHKKAGLRKDLDSWRGEPFTDAEADGFDITKLLGVFCKLQVVHNKSGDRVFANVNSIMTTKKKAKGVSALVGFSVEDPEMDVYESLPEWLQNKIADSKEWADDTNVDHDSDPSEEDESIDIKDVPF